MDGGDRAGRLTGLEARGLRNFFRLDSPEREEG
jgi:hypothetical protein